MTMHNRRIKRHLVENILASIVGGSLIGAEIQRSWILLGVALVVGVLLVLQDKDDIEAEESETPPILETVQLTDEEDGLRISDEVVLALRGMAGKKLAQYITEEGDPFYQEGLKDGAAMTAQYVLGLMEEEDEG